MGKKTKICFVGDLSSTFIKRDYELLKNYFEVSLIEPPKKKLEWLKYAIVFAKKIKKSDLTFSWFAGWRAAFAVFFSKLYNKKSIVVIGGYDAAYVPELKYGAFTNLKEMIPAKYVYKNVNKTLVVDLSLKKDIIKNANVSGDNIDYLPTGFNLDHWKPKGEKKNIVLTVAIASDMQRVKLKGLDTFVRSAKYIPEAKFIVVSVKGDAKKYLERISSKNVELVEFLPENELLQCYQMAKVYCQLSLREGLPTTLCEAMLCECTPVGANVQGVKTAIGDTGFYADYGDEKATVSMIKEALISDKGLGKKARERIERLFPEKRRREGLIKLISEMMP